MRQVPRSFKTPFFPVLQIVGIVGTAYMMFHISTDPATRIRIFALSAVIFAALAVYAVIWVKCKLKVPVLKSAGVRQVMSMENPMYYYVRHNKNKPDSEKKLEICTKL